MEARKIRMKGWMKEGKEKKEGVKKERREKGIEKEREKECELRWKLECCQYLENP